MATSTHSTPRIKTGIAGGSIDQGAAVKLNDDGKTVTKCTAATDKSIGILQNTGGVTTGQQCEIALPGGGGEAKLAGTVASGDLLAPNSDGHLVATTTENDRVIAMAMSGGVDDDIIGVEVLVAVH